MKREKYSKIYHDLHQQQNKFSYFYLESGNKKLSPTCSDFQLSAKLSRKYLKVTQIFICQDDEMRFSAVRYYWNASDIINFYAMV